MCSQASAESVYSKLDLKETCVIARIGESSFGSLAWKCRGYKDIPVYVAVHDLKYFVSFGDMAEEEPAVSQSLGSWSSLDTTIEWVLKDGEPIATILRWAIGMPADVAGDVKADADGYYRGQVLVITQLGQGKTCHIGYVDARATKNANKLARDAAGLLAGIWDCTSQPKLLGGGGLSLGLTD